MQLEKVYEPKRFEPHWAKWWEDSSLFVADPSKPGEAFSIAIPPPNVTGSLHIGHMLEHTLMDMIVRWNRMCGKNVLWTPGMDHAGIATQMVVESELAKNNINRRDLGRVEFEKKVWEWKEQSGGRIEEQMRQIGDSVDWTRSRFTMDEGLSRAVREIFVRLYEKDLIYRGQYMVNWCPRCNTALSDLEVMHEDTAGSLWHVRYPVVGSDEFLVVATTRPETMLGDTAVAINAADERYTHLHGKMVRLPLVGREIPIILDDMADPEFGTGVVKVTPAHDPNDFEAGKRHNLPHVKVINEAGAMTEEAGAAYAGLDRFDARKKVLADLKEAGLLEKVAPHNLPISMCQRCRTIVEPLVSTQWFVKMKPLAAPAIKAVEDGSIQFIPANFANTYFEWMNNIRDWCISRQLWWGHRIPAWHCATCGKATVARVEPTACAHCGSASIEQDTDVLDTWFSSGLWPFSTLGWPEKTADLDRYYPTSVLITSYDIIFFWVARMIFMGIECTGKIPFHKVYIHGLVRDAQRQKMSKTRGNVVDPLVMTAKYGTDATRMSLLLGAPPGTDIIFTEDRMESSRAFANKIWNAARFLFLNMERAGVETWVPAEQESYLPEPVNGVVTLEEHAQNGLASANGNSEILQHLGSRRSGLCALEDRWIFSRLNACATQMNKALNSYRFHDAAQVVWTFFWREFCDWYVELKKLRFEENSGLNAHWRNILTVFESALRMLHPAMPFLSEELWQRLASGHGRKASIAVSLYPQPNAAADDAEAEQQMAMLQEIISSARNLRADAKLDPKEPLDASIYGVGPVIQLAEQQREAIERLANVKLTVSPADAPRTTGPMRSTPEFDLVLAVSAAQLGALKGRLEKEIADLNKVILSSERQLSNEDFLKKAPEKVLEGMRAKLADYHAQREKSQKALASLAGA